MIAADFQPKIIRFTEIDSTNNKLKELATHGADEGTVVVAERQTAGRGRGKRIWHSPPGGLYFSTLLYPNPGRLPTDLSLLAGAAVTQAVQQILPKHKQVSVKWPNDCLIGWKKVGGILSEHLGEERNHLCVVGIGINVNTSAGELEPFRQNPFSATSFNVESGGGVFETERVLDIVSKKLFSLYRLYQEQGFEPIQFIWEKNCQFVGKKVELRESGWRESEKIAHKQGVTVGTFLGIDESGALVLSNQKGERHLYITGEIACFWP